MSYNGDDKDSRKWLVLHKASEWPTWKTQRDAHLGSKDLEDLITGTDKRPGGDRKLYKPDTPASTRDNTPASDTGASTSPAASVSNMSTTYGLSNDSDMVWAEETRTKDQKD